MSHLNVEMQRLDSFIKVGDWSYGEEYLDIMLNYILYGLV
jgi:hypothetical protein